MRKRKIIHISAWVSDSHRNEDKWGVNVCWLSAPGMRHAQPLGTFYSNAYELNGPLRFQPVIPPPKPTNNNARVRHMMGMYDDELMRMSVHNIFTEERFRPTEHDWRMKIALQRKMQVVKSLATGLDEKIKIAAWTAIFVTILQGVIYYVAG